MYDLSDQANEMRAKLITIQSEVNFNTEQVAKTKRYSDLVHAAWKEAIALKKNVKSLNGTLAEQQDALEDEEEQRKATDGLLLGGFSTWCWPFTIVQGYHKIVHFFVREISICFEIMGIVQHWSEKNSLERPRLVHIRLENF